jgi:hypothetical protein
MKKLKSRELKQSEDLRLSGRSKSLYSLAIVFLPGVYFLAGIIHVDF